MTIFSYALLKYNWIHQIIILWPAFHIPCRLSVTKFLEPEFWWPTFLIPCWLSVTKLLSWQGFWKSEFGDQPSVFLLIIFWCWWPTFDIPVIIEDRVLFRCSNLVRKRWSPIICIISLQLQDLVTKKVVTKFCVTENQLRKSKCCHQNSTFKKLCHRPRINWFLVTRILVTNFWNSLQSDYRGQSSF